MVLSVLAGVALAGLAFPLLGGAGLAARAASQTFLDLPSELSTAALPRATRVLDKNGGLIATFFLENRQPVTLADVPVSAQTALIAIEDSRFYEHNGIDVKGTARALARNSSAGGVQQGGSTLTQQYVKNMLLEAARGKPAEQQAARERSTRRKLQEARYALALEKTHTKAQILEGYLNIAYYANGVYGIGAAASHYFSEPVQKLTLAQGALLAGMVQNPTRFDPQHNPLQAKTRRDVVLARMLELGRVNPKAYASALHTPLRLKITAVSSGCEAPGVKAPFFCDYVRRYLEEGPGGAVLGDSAERQQALLAGGLTIRTTLDPTVQRAAQAAVDQQAPAGDPSGVAAVADTVVPGTGAVSAMAVDRQFGEKPGQTKVNYALGGSVGFQAGSTFKAFVLSRALQMGIPTGLTLFAPQKYCPTAFPYQLADGTCGPSNAGDSEFGTYDLIQATWRSVNTYYVQLEERTGLITPPGLAESLGVRNVQADSFDGSPLRRGIGAFTLGVDQVSPLAMAAAYASFAAHGKYCPPAPVVSITDGEGKPIQLANPPCKQALEAGIADTVTSILRGVIDGPDPLRTGVGATIGRPAAGKTGTTTSSTAAWFIGYTPQLSTAVWVGTPRPSKLQKVTINGRYYAQVYGGTLPASIWRQTMATALKGVPPVDFEGASLQVSQGALVRLPDVTGQPVAFGAQLLRDAGFAVLNGPAVAASPIPAGSVALTQPSGGTMVPAGSTIILVPSNGQLAASPTPAPLATATPFFSPIFPTSTPAVPSPAATTPAPARGQPKHGRPTKPPR